MRTADLDARASREEIAELERIAAGRPEIASVAELEAGLSDAAARVEALASGVSPGPDRPPAAEGAMPLRRGKRGAGIG